MHGLMEQVARSTRQQIQLINGELENIMSGSKSEYFISRRRWKSTIASGASAIAGFGWSRSRWVMCFWKRDCSLVWEQEPAQHGSNATAVILRKESPSGQDLHEPSCLHVGRLCSSDLLEGHGCNLQPWVNIAHGWLAVSGLVVWDSRDTFK